MSSQTMRKRDGGVPSCKRSRALFSLRVMKQAIGFMTSLGCPSSVGSQGLPLTPLVVHATTALLEPHSILAPSASPSSTIMTLLSAGVMTTNFSADLPPSSLALPASVPIALSWRRVPPLLDQVSTQTMLTLHETQVQCGAWATNQNTGLLNRWPR